MGKERLAEEAQKDIFKSPFIQHMEAIDIRRIISIKFGVCCPLDFFRNEEKRKVIGYNIILAVIGVLA